MCGEARILRLSCKVLKGGRDCGHCNMRGRKEIANGRECPGSHASIEGQESRKWRVKRTNDSVRAIAIGRYCAILIGLVGSSEVKYGVRK